jgi:hypothetical protein
VYSFEFHAQRARKAKEEVAAHGLASVVGVFLRDIEGLVSSASQPHKRAHSIYPLLGLCGLLPCALRLLLLS